MRLQKQRYGELRRRHVPARSPRVTGRRNPHRETAPHHGEPAIRRGCEHEAKLGAALRADKRLLDEVEAEGLHRLRPRSMPFLWAKRTKTR
jgi:hypothetical protein